MNKWLMWLGLMPMPLLAHTGPHVVVPPVPGIVVDGDLADWPREVEWHAISTPDSKSLTARFAVGVDRARGILDVAIDVIDDVVALDDASGARLLAVDDERSVFARVV